jgi:peptidoglycan/LPS O-acetylase OafA/YrhL
MRSLKIIILGTLIGILVGAISLTIAYAGLVFSKVSSHLPAAIVVSTLAGSIAASALCIALGYLLTHRERSIVAPLVTVAVASLVVLPGNYVNGSLVPPALYGLAVLNGLLIALLISPLCAAGGRSGNSNPY